MVELTYEEDDPLYQRIVGARDRLRELGVDTPLMHLIEINSSGIHPTDKFFQFYSPGYDLDKVKKDDKARIDNLNKYAVDLENMIGLRTRWPNGTI